MTSARMYLLLSLLLILDVTIAAGVYISDTRPVLHQKGRILTVASSDDEEITIDDPSAILTSLFPIIDEQLKHVKEEDTEKEIAVVDTSLTDRSPTDEQDELKTSTIVSKLPKPDIVASDTTTTEMVTATDEGMFGTTMPEAPEDFLKEMMISVDASETKKGTTVTETDEIESTGRSKLKDNVGASTVSIEPSEKIEERSKDETTMQEGPEITDGPSKGLSLSTSAPRSVEGSPVEAKFMTAVPSSPAPELASLSTPPRSVDRTPVEAKLVTAVPSGPAPEVPPPSTSGEFRLAMAVPSSPAPELPSPSLPGEDRLPTRSEEASPSVLSSERAAIDSVVSSAKGSIPSIEQERPTKLPKDVSLPSVVAPTKWESPIKSAVLESSFERTGPVELPPIEVLSSPIVERPDPKPIVTSGDRPIRKIETDAIEIHSDEEHSTGTEASSLHHSSVQSTEKSHDNHPRNHASPDLNRSLKMTVWISAAVCISLIVVGVVFGLYFTYLHPRLRRQPSIDLFVLDV